MTRGSVLLATLVLISCSSPETEPDGPPLFNVWTASDGLRTDAVKESYGPGHCGWHTTLFLEFRDTYYVRDTDDVFERRWLPQEYEHDARLPSEALKTDFKSDGRRLWVLPGSDDIVYVEYPLHVELWPELNAGCA